MWSITLKDLKQMDEFLDPVKPLKLNQEEVNYLNRLQAGKKKTVQSQMESHHARSILIFYSQK